MIETINTFRNKTLVKYPTLSVEMFAVTTLHKTFTGDLSGSKYARVNIVMDPLSKKLADYLQDVLDSPAIKFTRETVFKRIRTEASHKAHADKFFDTIKSDLDDIVLEELSMVNKKIKRLQEEHNEAYYSELNGCFICLDNYESDTLTTLREELSELHQKVKEKQNEVNAERRNIAKRVWGEADLPDFIKSAITTAIVDRGALDGGKGPFGRTKEAFFYEDKKEIAENHLK